MRFEREAKTLAALNRPHIAQIYGVEDAGTVGALVMELVDGEDLAQRIARGPIPLDEALPIARQIAEIFEAAHDAGIIHRDLKPANIKVRPDGTVKVLDFGLAKSGALGAPGGGARAAASATVTSPAITMQGVILGTAAYMAPEQAKGKPVDRRADIWAFGCVLYEMLTGHRAFQGEDVTDTIAAVVTKEPDWSRLPVSTPSSIVRLLRRCLDKDRKRRLDSAATARLDLDDAHTPASIEAPATGGARLRLWQALAAAFALAAVLATLLLLQRPAPVSRAETATVRFVVDAVPGAAFAHPGEGQDLPAASISPDGSKIVYSARSAGVVRLWLRALDDVVATPLAGTEGVSAPPFWSPDNDAVAFVAGGRLRRLATSGGLIQTVSPVVNFYGGAWNRAGVMVVSDDGRLHRVSAAGGSLEALTLTGTTDDTFFLPPAFLPDGEHFLFHAVTLKGGILEGSIMAASLTTGRTSMVVPSVESEARYSSGHLTFLRDGVLMAQPFDAATRRTTGDAFPVATPVRAGWSVSDNGMLVYRASQPADRIQLTWLDRRGQTIGTVGEPHHYGGVDVSPEGSRIAVHRHTGEGGDVWIHESRGTVTRLTFDPAKHHASPVWSPDGRRIVSPPSATAGGACTSRRRMAAAPTNS